jgi:alpha-mannosidase
LGETASFALLNAGSYGVSFDDRQNILYPTLLRSPSYCAHPIDDRTVMPQDRFSPYTDQGERIFRFAFLAGSADAIKSAAPRKALEFNEGVISLSFYPTGNGDIPVQGVTLTGDDEILLTAWKKAEVGDGYILRLFNSADEDKNCTVSIFGHTMPATLSPYEIATFRAAEHGIHRDGLMEGLLQE